MDLSCSFNAALCREAWWRCERQT